MPSYVKFKHKESGLTVNCHQVDTILANHFSELAHHDPKEWFLGWYHCFAPLLASGRSVKYIVDMYEDIDSEVNRENNELIAQVGNALYSLFDITSGYTAS